MVAAFDLRSAQLTFFEPDGTLVSATRMPPDVYLTDLRGDRALGSRLAMLDRTRSEDQPDEIPVVIDAVSGEILWEREDLSGAVGRDCFNGRVGILNPQGGIVTTACEHEIVFLDHEDATGATVVAAPNYSPLLPGSRDVDANVEGILSIGGGLVSLSPAQRKPTLRDTGRNPGGGSSVARGRSASTPRTACGRPSPSTGTPSPIWRSGRAWSTPGRCAFATA